MVSADRHNELQFVQRETTSKGMMIAGNIHFARYFIILLNDIPVLDYRIVRY